MKDLIFTLKFTLKVIEEYGLENVNDENENNLKECIEEQLKAINE